jgi:putative PEP-CTERM system TPR-repeat lipoprotein
MLRQVKKQTLTFTLISVAAILSVAFISGCGKTQSTESLLTEAKQYQQKGDNKAAIIQLKNALQKNPDNIETRYLLGTIYNEVGDPVSAEKELRKAVSLGMDAAKIAPELAKSLYMQNQFPKVLEALKPISAGKVDASITILQGNTYLRLGKDQEAKEAFENVLKENSNHPEALVGLARHALSSNDFKTAYRYLDQATEKNPSNFGAWLFKGDLLRAQNRVEPALAAYDQALKAKPDNMSANIAKAYLHIAEKKFDAAKSEIDAARKSAPTHIIVYYSQALLDFNQGKHAAAWDSLQQVLRVAPEHMPSVLLAGASQYALGSLPQAELHLKKYLEQNPDDLYARKLMARTLLKSGQTARALTTLSPALKNTTKDPQLLALAGEVHMQAKEFSKATEYFEKASELAPESAQIKTSLGMSKIGQGDNARAISEFEKAISLDAKSSQAGLLLVMTQLHQKNYDKALSAAQAIEKEEPENPLVQNLKGGIYLGKKDIESARSSFMKALKLQPAFFPAADNLAKLDLRDKKPDLAKKRYLSILDNDKKNLQAITALAHLARLQNDVSETTSWLEKANSENPDKLEAALNLAGHYLRIGEKVKALTLLQNLLVSKPNSPELLDALALAQMANEKPAAALDTYHKLTVLLPESPQAQYQLANAHMSMKNIQAATDALKRSLSLNPDYLEAQIAMASLEMQKGDFGNAIAISKKIQQKNTKSSAGYVLEGDILMAQRKPMLAISSYEHAFTLHKNSSILIKIFSALKLSGKWSLAETRMIQWLKEYPDDASARVYLAEAYIGEKKHKEAITQFQILLKQNPNSPVILNNIAWSYYQDKDPQNALTHAEKALQIAADSPAVMDTLGWILVEQGNTSRGLPLLQKAATLAPDVADIRYHLAQSLAKTGDKAGAKKELEKLLASGKPFANIEEAKALLKKL